MHGHAAKSKQNDATIEARRIVLAEACSIDFICAARAYVISRHRRHATKACSIYKLSDTMCHRTASILVNRLRKQPSLLAIIAGDVGRNIERQAENEVDISIIIAR